LLDDILGNRDVISDSDQGKSFRAIWDFLMSPDRQSELTELIGPGAPGYERYRPSSETLLDSGSGGGHIGNELGGAGLQCLARRPRTAPRSSGFPIPCQDMGKSVVFPPQ